MILRNGPYTWVEKAGRACLKKDTLLLWWGSVDQIDIPPDAAPVEVLLDFSSRRLTESKKTS